MTDRAPLLGVAGFVAILAVLAIVGGALGVGPLASTVPPERVTDPVDMVSRSVQAVIDANAVHVDATLDGRLPGAIVGRPEPSVSIDGTTASVDVEPHDARTRTTLDSAALGVRLESVSVWDGLWYRSAPGAPWTKESLGALSARSGLDLNPLTLGDRIHALLTGSGPRPGLTDVPCASVSGTCHRVTVDVGTAASPLLAALLPAENAAALPAVATSVVLDTDAKSLRPAHVVAAMRSPDGSVDVRLVMDASAWDEMLMIEEPAAGS